MTPSPQAESTTENKENATAAGEIKPDPDYEWRRQAMDLIKDWQSHDSDENKDKEYRENTLLPKIKDLVRHNLTNNAEVEACDILMEIERIEILNEMAEQLKHIDFERICLYLLSCVPFTPDPENINLINVARDLYTKFGKTIEALCCAMKSNDLNEIHKIFNNTSDGATKLQMAMMLGRQQIFLDIDNATLSKLNANVKLHKDFLAFARELDLMTPKKPEEVYKAHLEPTRPFNTQQMKNLPLQNLASSFVNGFVNSGFGTDAFFKDEKSSGEWLSKHKDWSAFSTTATFGLIHHWNVDSLNDFDHFTRSTDVYVKAGALLATGIVFSGVQDPDIDPAFGVLREFLFNKELPLRIASIFGLGLAYANCKRGTAIDPDDSVVQELRKVIGDDQPPVNAEIKGLAALSLGLVLMGTGSENSDVVDDLQQYLMGHYGQVDLKDANMRFVALAIGLIYLGKQDQCDETVLGPLRTLPAPFGKMASLLVDVCAYAGTGNVLKVQEMLYICSEHPDAQKDKQKEESAEKPPAGAPLPDITAPPATAKSTTTANGTTEDSSGGVSVAAEPEPSNSSEPPPTPSKAPNQKKVEEIESSMSQSIAVLGISLVAMGEDIGSSMSLRLFGHLYRYGEPAIRRAVPLALAMLSPSNPQLTIIETLSKYSHDSDVETARNAIFALGLVGAGTNNARVLATLRQLASYHSRDQKTMMLLRIAQGLVHLGKGTMTLNPFHSDRQLLCPTSVAALLTTCLAFIDSEHMILNSRQHYLLFTLVAAIQPRMLITVVRDPNNAEELIQKPVQVRVGQAVDVVAQAGRPRTITGFQTHTTPVLLAYGERAELADEDYTPLTPILEGIVILEKAEEKEKKEQMKKAENKNKEEKMEH